MTSILHASNKSLLIPRDVIDLTQYDDSGCLELFSNTSIPNRDKLFFDEFLPVYIKLEIPLNDKNLEKDSTQSTENNNTNTKVQNDIVLLSLESLEKYLEYVFLSLDVTILGSIMAKSDTIAEHRSTDYTKVNHNGLTKLEKSFLISTKSLKSADIVRKIQHGNRVTVIWKSVVELEHPRAPILDSKVIINTSFTLSSLFSQPNFIRDIMLSNINSDRPDEVNNEMNSVPTENLKGSDSDSDSEILEDFKLAEVSNIFDGLSINDSNCSKVVLSTKRLYTSQQLSYEADKAVTNFRGHHGGSSLREIAGTHTKIISTTSAEASQVGKGQKSFNPVVHTNKLPDIPINCSKKFPIYSTVDLKLKYTRAEGTSGTLFTTVTLDSASPTTCVIKGLKLELSNGEVDLNINHDNHFPLILNAGESANLVYRMRVFNNRNASKLLHPVTGINGALGQGVGMNPSAMSNTNRNNGFITSYAQTPTAAGTAKSGVQRLKVTVDSIPILNSDAKEQEEHMVSIDNQQTHSYSFGPAVSTTWNTQADFNALLTLPLSWHPVVPTTPLPLSSSSLPLGKAKYPAGLSNLHANNKLGVGKDSTNINNNTSKLGASGPFGAKLSSLSGVSIQFIGPPSVNLGEIFQWKIFVFNNSAFNKRISMMVQPNDYHQYAQQLKQQSIKQSDKPLLPLRLYPVLSRAALLKSYIQPGHISGDEGLVCLNNDIRLGDVLGPQCSYETNINLLALTKGIHTLNGIRIVDLITDDSYECQGMINVAVG
ncbi:hypothetical protein NADFUDRAFT_40435 [Nadsonia fulvescens var. elongata DSM 6958]|uniref:Trafficking protein particle complex II-specific subunit 65 IgD3 domain-containing protein n=1 Tax=Nadsonia fulvescens var. elongata DSM 6958 TaxID=857566 RepID=A0A1E3PPN7_9ASCO|nr:hypothetical protein NADFUDRAFT_40435 [Nadsonia fulvescens var. elongata DSM 6958]